MASADIKVFGSTYLFAVLLLIGLTLFYTQGVFVVKKCEANQKQFASSLQCNSLSQIHSNVYFRLKLCSMIGRAYMGEVLRQV